MLKKTMGETNGCRDMRIGHGATSAKEWLSHSSAESGRCPNEWPIETGEYRSTYGRRADSDGLKKYIANKRDPSNNMLSCEIVRSVTTLPLPSYKVDIEQPSHKCGSPAKSLAKFITHVVHGQDEFNPLIFPPGEASGGG